MRSAIRPHGGRALAAGAAVLAIACSAVCHAGDYYTTVPFLPTVKIGPDAAGATPAREVYGKEYSHTDWFTAATVLGLDPNLVNIEDHDAFATPDPLQVVSWDGLPGPYGPLGPGSGGPNSGSVDAFDFGSPTYSFEHREGQIDALANRGDFLFRQVTDNTATLLFSVTADLGISGAAKAHVHFEDPDPVDLSPTGDVADVWAVIEAPPAGPGLGPGVNHHVVEDLDALEVWGPEPPTHNRPAGIPTPVVEGYIGGFGVGPATADANRFSLDVDAATGVSVFAFSASGPSAGLITPWVPHSEIVAAVESLLLSGMGDGLRLDPESLHLIDVDGTMASDVEPDLDHTSLSWGPGDELLFTVDPFTAGVIDASGAVIGSVFMDGGEIMHLSKTGLGPGAFAVSYLSHGGHLWDTAFDVSGTFGYEFEDVDALEAVGTLTGDIDIPTPEPSAAVLAVVGAAIAGWRRRGKPAVA